MPIGGTKSVFICDDGLFRPNSIKIVQGISGQGGNQSKRELKYIERKNKGRKEREILHFKLIVDFCTGRAKLYLNSIHVAPIGPTTVTVPWRPD